jgi:hypothetical protein
MGLQRFGEFARGWFEIFNTGLESPVNRQAGMPALQSAAVSSATVEKIINF